MIRMFNSRIWISFIAISFLIVGIYFLVYRPYEHNGQLLREPPVKKNAEALGELRKSAYLTSRVFNISGNDVMVFLHIQKTGGTYFGRNLVKNLDLERACVRVSDDKTRYACQRPNSDEQWLLSRYSTGWLCGLHADWTTLTSCVPNVLKSGMKITNTNITRLFYITMLREPVNRFLSEFKHVQRGATWSRSKFTCNGTDYKVKPCYTGPDWRDVTLTEFLSCPHNAAVNRQTRMLANLTQVGCNCYNITRRSISRQYEKNMVKSAFETLNNMAYFGLLEYQRESQYLFEMTFDLRFKGDFRQDDNSNSWGDTERKLIDTKQLLQIRKLNKLDRRLYSYAKTLFFKRLKYFELMHK